MERTCGPMNKNRIEGAVDRGERACDREASVTKGKRCRSRGGPGQDSVLTRGDLASRLKGRRRISGGARSQQRPYEPPQGGEGPNEKKSWKPLGSEGQGHR